MSAKPTPPAATVPLQNIRPSNESGRSIGRKNFRFFSSACRHSNDAYLGGTVLDGAAGVHPLRLGQDFAAGLIAEAGQSHQRSVPGDFVRAFTPPVTGAGTTTRTREEKGDTRGGGTTKEANGLLERETKDSEAVGRRKSRESMHIHHDFVA